MYDPILRDWLLPYVACLAQRPLAGIDLVVIHCTELPDLAVARSYAERVLYADGSGNCGHYYLDRDGASWRFVPGDHVAHHTRGYNMRSIGIELVNTGRWPDWLNSRHQVMTEPYPAAQIAGLRALLAHLRQAFPGLRHIAGHEDLDIDQVPASDDSRLRVFRKRDPGPRFPWDEVLRYSPLKRLTTPL